MRILATFGAAASLALVALPAGAHAANCGNYTTGNGLGIVGIKIQNVSCSTGKKVVKTAMSSPSGNLRRSFYASGRTWHCTSGARYRCTSGRGIVSFGLQS